MSENRDKNRINRSYDSQRSGSDARKKSSTRNNQRSRSQYSERPHSSVAHVENLNVSEKRRADHQPESQRASEERRRRREEAVQPAKIRELTAKQRKVRTRLKYIGLFAAIVIVALIFSVTIVFKTDNIKVEGETPYSSEEIINASGLHYGENIFLSPRKAAAKNIVDVFPYIEEAEIDFRIPSTQVITVVGAIPSYEVSIDGGYVVVSSRGRVLAHNTEETAGIPLLRGVKVKDTEVGEYIKFEKTSTQQILTEVIDSINDNDIPNIYGIDISNAANIKLNYDNRITILLGVPEDVGYKLRTAVAIIDTELASTDKGELDVSLANSERKSSYFTPIYSNTIEIESGASESPSTDNSSKASSAAVSSENESALEAENQDADVIDYYDEEDIIDVPDEGRSE